MANIRVLKEVRSKLARRNNAIQRAYADDTISTAIFGLVQFVETTPVLHQIAQALLSRKDGTTVAEWREAVKKHAWLQPPVERDAKARLCYEFLAEWYGKKDEENFNFTMAFVDVGHRMSPSSNYDECARIFVASFVDPLVEYLDEELDAMIADEEVRDDDVVEPNPENAKRVFIVHGRDLETLKIVRKYLEESGFEPLTFEEARMLLDTSSPNILQVVDKGMQESGAVVVLITPDDVGRQREESEEELKARPRENVVFEAGIAFGRYRSRTVLVEYEASTIFSDLHGYYVVRLRKGKDGIEGLDKIVQQVNVAVSKLKRD